MKRLQDNVTIITGGGKGIGFGLAQAFAEEGSDLVLTGRTESRLLTVVRAGLRHRRHRSRADRVADGEDAGSDHSQRPHHLPCRLSN